MSEEVGLILVKKSVGGVEMCWQHHLPNTYWMNILTASQLPFLRWWVLKMTIKSSSSWMDGWDGPLPLSTLLLYPCLKNIRCCRWEEGTCINLCWLEYVLCFLYVGLLQMCKDWLPMQPKVLISYVLSLLCICKYLFIAAFALQSLPY